MVDLKQVKKNDSKTVTCTLILIILAVVAVFGAYTYYDAGYMNNFGLSKASLSKEAAVELFNNAKSFNFRCKRKTLRNRTYISVDQSWYGIALDNFNIFNSKTYFYVGDEEELFHIGFTHNWKPKNADKKLITATTYEIFSPKNEVIGHLQETSLEREGFPKAFYYVYYDQNDNEGDFYIRKGVLYDKSGHVAATTKVNNFGFFKQGIEIFKEEGSVIPYKDIFFLYLVRYADWRNGQYSY